MVQEISDQIKPGRAVKQARSRPLQWHLTFFGVAILAPGLVVSAIFAVHFASIDRARYQRDALELARSVAADVDREVGKYVGIAQAFSLAQGLQRNDFASLDKYARKIQGVLGIEVVVRDLSGQQLLNTRLPYGASLPMSLDPVLVRAARSAVQTRQPIVSDLLIGAVAKSLVLVINVPVIRDGEAVYITNFPFPPELILRVLAAREFPPEFLAAVYDSTFHLIARSAEHEKFVGSSASPDFQRVATQAEGTWNGVNRNGEAVSGAYVRTQFADWKVGVTVPTEVLEAPLRRSLLFIAALAGIGLIVSFLLALLYGRELSRPMRALASGAVSLGRGDLVVPIRGGVREIEQVSEFLSVASQDLIRQTDEREVAQSLLRQSEERVRRMTAEALQQSQEQLRLLVDSVKEYAILMLDPKGIITTWSKGAERINGFRSDEMIGQHFSRFYSPKDVVQGKPQLELETAATEGRYEVDGWRIRKDGTAFWAEVVVAPIYDAGGRLAGFSKVTRDATERMRYETALQEKNSELQAAVKELDAFSYSVSHDLRAPLRAIDGFSKIVLKQCGSILPEDAREYLVLVRDNAAQMTHLVDDLLRFSRLGRQPLNRQRVTTATIVEKALGDARRQAEGRSISVSVSEMPDLMGDPALIKQVFANLIQNAFKYTRKRVDAVIEIGSSKIGREQIFFVRDNGAGFDMAYYDKLFGVFQRLHRAEDFEGTGVGLAIVQRIIERHGGRIWAKAAVDEGATFYFTAEASAHG